MTKLKPFLRCMIVSDLDWVAKIDESEMGPAAYTKYDFRQRLETKSRGVVALVNGQFAGYAMFKPRGNAVDLDSVVVSAPYQRRGIGESLIDFLKSTLSPPRLNVIQTIVRESNLDAQLFFKAQGFRAEATLYRPYDTGEEDGYLFVHRRFSREGLEG